VFLLIEALNDRKSNQPISASPWIAAALSYMVPCQTFAVFRTSWAMYPYVYSLSDSFQDTIFLRFSIIAAAGEVCWLLEKDLRPAS
jgi:hypothetical protein